MAEYDELLKELKYIKTLLATKYIKDFETKNDKILFLDKAGFETGEITNLLDTTPGTVAVAKSQAKGKKKGKKKAKQSSSVGNQNGES